MSVGDCFQESLRFLRNLCIDALRRKHRDKISVSKSPLDRTLNKLSLIMLTISNASGMNFLFVPTMLIAIYAGSQAFLCILLAGIVALLNGCCYAELSSIIPTTGSAYDYAFFVTGELSAALMGWQIALVYVLDICLISVAGASALDVVANYSISDFSETHFGLISNDSNKVLNSYINFPAALLLIIGSLTILMKSSWSSFLNTVSTLIASFIVVIATVYMFIKLDKDVMHEAFSSKNFLFFDFHSLLLGTAIAFNLFTSFEIPTLMAEEVIEPRRNIPFSMFVSIIAISFFMIIHTIAILCFVPSYDINPQLGLSDIIKTPWLQYLCGAGTVIFSIGGIVPCLFGLSRVLIPMANDCLMCEIFADVHPTLKIPLKAQLIIGGICLLFVAFFTYKHMVEVVGLIFLIIYTFVACSLIILRYARPELHNSADSRVGFLRKNFHRLNMFENRTPGRTVTVALVFFILISIATQSFILFYGANLLKGRAWAITLLLILLLLLVLSVFAIAIFEPGGGNEWFKVRVTSFHFFVF